MSNPDGNTTLARPGFGSALTNSVREAWRHPLTPNATARRVRPESRRLRHADKGCPNASLRYGRLGGNKIPAPRSALLVLEWPSRPSAAPQRCFVVSGRKAFLHQQNAGRTVCWVHLAQAVRDDFALVTKHISLCSIVRVVTLWLSKERAR